MTEGELIRLTLDMAKYLHQDMEAYKATGDKVYLTYIKDDIKRIKHYVKQIKGKGGEK